MGMSRRELRENIFKLLFRVEFNTKDEMKEQTSLFFEEVEEPIKEADQSYIEEKYDAIVALVQTLDTALNEEAECWTTGRMGKVELTILRLALYEIRYDDTIPNQVAVNEAVELAKKFGQDGAGSFVNGILANFV